VGRHRARQAHHVKKTSEAERVFIEDLRTAVVLGNYVRHWGLPDERVTSSRHDEVVQVYSFPPNETSAVHRFATVGVSGVAKADGKPAQWELLMVLPADLGGAQRTIVTNLLLDVMAYSLRTDVRFAAGTTIPVSPLTPSVWNARALLIDEPRGEAPELSTFHLGVQHIDLFWVVPIHEAEYHLIKEKGLSALDDASSATNSSLIDPNRRSLA
jgi:hypothetical protein